MSDFDTIRSILDESRIIHTDTWTREQVLHGNKVSKLIYIYDKGVVENRIELKFSWNGILERVSVTP